METLVNNLVPVALISVSVVLILGLWTMLRGDKPGMSQKLMRWRVGLQFLAIVIAMAAIYFAGRTP
jgi:membrane protease YdiL (CAAX protease family)